MNDMVLVKSASFNGIALDCYVKPTQEDKGDFWATREQIGALLEYEYPNDSIRKIHERHAERLDMFSTSVKLTQVEGSREVIREIIVYNFKGLLEVCRYSNQPKADAVMDWLWSVADEIRRTGSYSIKNEPFIPKNAISEAALIFGQAGIEGNQLTLALDKLYKFYTGTSALRAAGVELEAPDNCQLLTPTEIGKLFGLSARKVNDLLAGAGLQHKIADKWEAIGDGKKYSVMQDTGKAHSDGTPIRQLKWTTDIIPVVETLLEDCA
jgi:prophage antirepressor-like protein